MGRTLEADSEQRRGGGGGGECVCMCVWGGGGWWGAMGKGEFSSLPQNRGYGGDDPTLGVYEASAYSLNYCEGGRDAYHMLLLCRVAISSDIPGAPGMFTMWSNTEEESQDPRQGP